MSGLNRNKTPQNSNVNRAFKSPFRPVDVSPNVPDIEKVANLERDKVPSEKVNCVTSEKNSTPKSENFSNPKSENFSTPKSENFSTPKSDNTSVPKSENSSTPKRPYTPVSRKVPNKSFRIPFKSPLSVNSNSPLPSSSYASPNLKRLHSPHPLGSKKISTSSDTPQSLNSKLQGLLKQEKDIDDEISKLEQEGYCTSELDVHIDKLHKYNDIKDLTQKVLGKLAELDGVSVASLHTQFGLDSID